MRGDIVSIIFTLFTMFYLRIKTSIIYTSYEFQSSIEVPYFAFLLNGPLMSRARLLFKGVRGSVFKAPR